MSLLRFRRKSASASLRAQLDELFEQAPEGIVLLDVQDRVLRINSEFSRIFGYSPDEAIGRHINDLIAPEDVRAEAEEYTHQLTYRKRVTAETIRRRKDGSRITVSLLAVPISVPDGQIAQFAIYRDITEQKMVEGVLTKQKALDELFGTVPVAIVLVDLLGKILHVNPEFSKMFGYSLDEAVGRVLDELIAPGEFRDEAEEISKRVRRLETLNVETVRARKDGSRFPVSILGVPVSIAGSQIAEFAIYRDLTERKRAEEELQLLVDLVPQNIVVLKPDGHVIYANRVARDYTGLNMEEFRSLEAASALFHPDDAKKVRALRERGLSTNEPFEIEARLLGKDGAYRWFLIRYNHLVEEGRVKRWYVTATEIESRKQEEERVRQENVRLEERTRIARELHDTFLQTIQGSKLVAEHALKSSDDRVRMVRALEQLADWLGRATEEGRAVLNSLRISTTQRNELADALRRAAEECRTQSPMEVSFSVVGSIKEMHPVVRDEVYRIGYEAIRNACTHSKARRLDVALSYARDLILRVRDNGCGIDPQVLSAGRAGHWGLTGMQERAMRIGGLLKISSSAIAGTEVQLSVPGSVAFNSDILRKGKDPELL